MSHESLMKVILAPHVSEKSTSAAEKHRQFVFKVATSANRNDIKRAVQLMFNVEVSSVQVCNVAGKVKRFGGMLGRRSGWKKAYVTLREGHDINFLGPQ